MTDTNRTWTMIDGRGDDLRFFVDDQARSLFVADNSGRTPDRTDDGPLVVCTAKPVLIGISKVAGRPTVRIPVRREAGLASGRLLFAETGLWAIAVLLRFGATFDLSPEVAGLRKALGEIETASALKAGADASAEVGGAS